jgi:hypothetical protein
MKLLDPIGGIRIISYNWVIHLTCTLSYTFTLYAIPETNKQFNKENIQICNYYQLMHVISFSIQIVD